MNDAHVHMVVNHFPIIGTIFGLGILITGIVMKNNVIKNVAYVLFVFRLFLALRVCLLEKEPKKLLKIYLL